ncbi:MAG: hypothetical protein U1E14_06370 [Geminicoccaceae bacterium]
MLPTEPVQLSATELPDLPAMDPLAVDDGHDEDLGDVGEHDDGTDGDDTLIGTDRDDNLDGGAGNDSIYGGAGNDSLQGNAGDDLVDGGTGNDSIDGGAGNDDLSGGQGDDDVVGGTGNDSVYGGSGNDVLGGGDGDDRVDGGTGIDTMDGGTGEDAIVVDHLHDFALEDPYGPDGGGIDTLQVNQGYAASLAEAMPQQSPLGLATFVLGDKVGVTLPGGANPFVQQVDPDIENVKLTGTAAHDILGDVRANRFVGNEGDNRLYGGGGDDWMDGGAGDDWLVGGSGSDVMHGSEGDDTYVLGLSDQAVDTIRDDSGSNTVRLNGAEAGRFAAVLDGDDLRLAYDGDEIAVIRDYLGHEGSFRGIDFGDGPQSFADFVHPGDMLAEFLARSGSDEADILEAREGGEWLDGKAGNDTLLGSAAADTLEGGNGSDVLRGGAGDDCYRVRAGDSGIDRVDDAQGRNVAELDDAAGQKLKAFLVGQDLWITADDRPFMVVENHAAHPDAFAGVKAGDKLVDPHDLTS